MSETKRGNKKIHFEERTYDVLKIIREVGEVGFNELFEKLTKGTNRISKTTLDKCLNYLVRSQQVKRREEIGQGNPVKYSFNNDLYLFKHLERIEANAFKNKGMLDDKSPLGAEKANMWVDIENEIAIINVALIHALWYYSIRPDRGKAYNEYSEAITEFIVPYLLKLHELVKPPLKMSDETLEILLKRVEEKLSYEISNHPHSLGGKTTAEELDEVNRLFFEKEEAKDIFQTIRNPNVTKSEMFESQLKAVQLSK